MMEDTYQVVYDFRYHDADNWDFVIVGIYSKVEDANTHLDRIKALPTYKSGAVLERKFEHIVRELTDVRLGALAVALNKLLP